MPWNDDTGPVPPSSEGQLLARTREKAASLADRRRRAWMATATSALLVAALATAVARNQPEGTIEIQAAAGGASPATTDHTTTTTLAVTTTLASLPSLPLPTTATSSPPRPTTTTTRPAPSTTPTTKPAASSTTTTAAACTREWDPTCGPFRWEPPPGPSQPVTVKVTVMPAAPKPGDTVTFRVVVDDPDGSELVDKQGIGADYGDGTPFNRISSHLDCVEGYGPKAPPAPRPVHEELVLTHVYARAGTFSFTLPVRTLGDCARGLSDGVGTATVLVTG